MTFTDRELLFILMVQQKRSKSGKVWIYANKRSALTCKGIDRMIGDGVCIAKKGINRLADMKVVSVIAHGKDMELTVNIPKDDKSEFTYEIESTQRNPIISFYEHNNDRPIAKCPYCNTKFIKVGNMKICKNPTCKTQLEYDRKHGK